MGQQQLLLLVLGIVIVGLAVVGGISAFNEHTLRSTSDQATNEAVRLSAQLLAWRAKPRSMGGGRGDLRLESASFSNLGMIARGRTLTASHTDEFFRNIGGLTGNRPYVQVRSRRAPDHYSRVYLYGPRPACLVHRARRPDAGASRGYTWDPIPSYNDLPAGCPGW